MKKLEKKKTIVNSDIKFDSEKNNINNDYIKTRFFNYYNNSCWVNCFLFIYKNIIFQKYKDNNFNKLCLSNEIQMFLNDIYKINDENTLYQGLWNYIINNSNYPNDI